MKQRVEIVLARALRSLPVDACTLGSGSEKDCDVLIVWSRADPIESSVTAFLDVLQPAVAELGCKVIVRHEHRDTVGSGPALHLMFYPSYVHAITCELPSLLAYAHDRGRYFIGDRNALAEWSSRYRDRRLREVQMCDLHVGHYVDIAIMNLIYLTTGAYFTPAMQKELLLYVMRFLVVEEMVDALPAEGPIAFWDWPELIRTIETRLPTQQTLVAWLRNRDDGRVWSASELRRGFLAALRLADCGLALLEGDDFLAGLSLKCRPARNDKDSRARSRQSDRDTRDT
jgi:hypothetical protein